MNNLIGKSSAQLLFLIMVPITLFVAYPIGNILMMAWWLAGDLMSMMFIEVSDPTQYTWLFEKAAGLLVGAGVSETIQKVLAYIISWFVVGLIAVVGGAVYTLLHLFLNRIFYGRVLPSRKKIYIKTTLFLNTVLVLSFWGIGYRVFISSPSMSLLGLWSGALFVGFILFVAWWMQHLLNQYACGIKITTEV